MSDKKQTQPPENLTGIKLIDIPKKAVGIKAIQSALNHVFSESGVVKGIQLLKNMNQLTGFDCPGCAWPDPDQKRAFLAEYCENGAKAIAEEATTNRVSPLFFATHTVQEISEWSDYEIGKSGRITHPMILREGATNYEETSWEEAFKTIGNELNSLKTPDEAIFYTSGRTSNEAAFLYQLFVRKYGTNNLPDCSNMCHESSGSGLSETLGIGKGSVTLEDFNHADLVIVIGQNPGTNHPRMLAALKNTKQNGGKIITINPLPEVGLINYVDPQNPLKWFGAGEKLTDLFLQVKINGDVALLKIILKLMKAQEEEKGGVFNHQFIKEKTHGLEGFLIDLEGFTIDELLPQTGLSLEIIKEATEIIIKNDKIIICWAMGLTQHKNAVDNIREVVNLLLLKGSIGKEGAGTCPVRGHSNVQGDRTMGIWEKPKSPFLDSLEKEFKFKAPRKNGYDVVAAIEAMYQKKASVFIGMGGNFISATPDTEYTAEALRNCSLTVQISTKLNRSHLVHGKQALILPCLGRSEKDIQKSGTQFITVENSMGVVHQSNGHLTPGSKHLLSEAAIVAGIAEATLKKSANIDWSLLITNYDLIRNKIEATIPGFENYNEKVRVKGGFYLPNNARENNYSATLTGKANFSTNLPSDIILAENQFMMMTIRTHDQYNTTIYGLNDRYRGVLNERRVIFMNPEDMENQGLSKLDRVNLTSHFQGEKRTAKGFLVVPYSIPKQCTATYFPEANVLVPLKSKARISHTPASKTVVITIMKHE